MNFEQASVTVAKIEQNVRTLIEKGNFSVETIVVDGYDFNKATAGEFREFRRFARDNGFELWFSATLREDATDKNRVPKLLAPYLDDIAILICLEPRGDFIHLNLVKDHDAVMAADMHLKLDPRILLIAEENQAERTV
jgi:hypothetical protein